MIKSKTEIMDSIKARFAEDTSDSTLSFIEDISDTFDDFAAKASDSTDWKAKFDENDKAWRQKYHDRFFSNEETPKESDPLEETEQPKPMNYEDLFTKGDK